MLGFTQKNNLRSFRYDAIENDGGDCAFIAKSISLIMRFHYNWMNAR